MGRCTLEDDRKLRSSTRVSAGDVLVIQRPVRDKTDLPDSYGVLHEDEHLYVVDKPAGMPVHPTASYMLNTLVNLSRKALPDTPPRLCHRLDRETSGIVIMAKDLESQKKIMRQFEDRKVSKSYFALVWGTPEPPEGTIRIPLRLSRVSKIRMKMETVSETDHGTGQPSTTRYSLQGASRRFALVSCKPETGRQHQIRIHMAHVGHPLVGDKIYGVDEDLFLQFLESGLDDEMMSQLLIPRHALHAASITFRHPATGEKLTVDSPLAPDIATLYHGDRLPTRNP
ncbi:MAG: RluA family pseudouridine synthase [Deltaproteobacteria bacterium]|nr:RluA family pseudouridine synthase [Deltaproteobacteria bacterium]